MTTDSTFFDKSKLNVRTTTTTEGITVPRLLCLSLGKGMSAGGRAVHREAAVYCPTRPPCGSTPKVIWTRTFCIAAAFAAAFIFAFCSCGVVLAVYPQPSDGSWLRRQRRRLNQTLRARDAGGAVGTVIAGGETGGLYTKQGIQEQERDERSRDDTSVSTSMIFCKSS